MTEFDPQLGRSRQDHDHDVLLIAGSRPEVARLAPVATAFAEAARIRALTVAAGPDPMTVHEVFEALGVPADITLLPGATADPPGRDRRDADDPARRPARRPRPVGGHGLRRRDDRGDRRAGRVLAADPGGAPAGRLGQRRPALPVPAGGQPAGHRPARVAVPVTGGTGRQPGRPERDRRRRHRWRPTRSPPTCARPPSGGCAAAAAAGAGRLDRADSLGVLAGLPDLLEREPDIEIVSFGELAAHGAAYPLLQHRAPRSSATSRWPTGPAHRGEPCWSPTTRSWSPTRRPRHARGARRRPALPSRATRSAASSAPP